MRPKCPATRIYLAAVLLTVLPAILPAQSPVSRIMRQDSTLNNLVEPPGYATAKPGSLASVARSGKGDRPMILIPGLGFGGGIFDEFAAGFLDEYRIYSVTLPGFAGSPAPPSPGEQTSFGEQTWTNGALQAIESLIEDEDMQEVVVVGHWLTGTQLALRLALNHPDKVSAVVILSGSTRMVVTDPTYAALYATPEKRVSSVDRFLAPRWFKTVTRETWDDNNFLPGDYAVHPVLGLRLWREAARPLLHVWVRYLCEFNAQDISVELKNLKVPTLVVKPGLEDLWYQTGQNYMEGYCHASWNGAEEQNPLITLITIPRSRVCMWMDQPEEVNRVVTAFLEGRK
jgi:pimeloyl-ACP methyl ester carboxylesterase